jgi:hypothetical protein
MLRLSNNAYELLEFRALRLLTLARLSSLRHSVAYGYTKFLVLLTSSTKYSRLYLNLTRIDSLVCERMAVSTMRCLKNARIII